MRKFIKFLLTLGFAALFCYIAWFGLIKEQLELYRHPLKYTDIVEKYADEYKLPPELIYAVIKTESNFNENAISHAGAKGLMQLMDDTNEWVASLLRENVHEEDYFHPETNIRRGAYLLSFLIKQFGSTKSAVAAYNAGIGRVSKWLENPEYSQDGVTLSHIPIGETDEYVKRVMETMIKYRELYFE